MTEKRVNSDLEPPSDDSGHLNKRIKIDGFADEDLPTVRETRKGVAPVKSE